MDNNFQYTDLKLKEAKLFPFKMLYVLFFGLCAPICQAAEEDNVPPQNNQAFIYVAPGTILSGVEHISMDECDVVMYATSGVSIYGDLSKSKITIVQIPDASISKSNFIANSNNSIDSGEFVAQRKGTEKSIKKLQDRVTEKIENTFFTSTERQQSILLINSKVTSGIVSSSSSFSSNFGNALILSDGIIYAFAAQLKKQKFYTSLGNLQVHFVDTSFLRGPPLNMV